MHRISLDTPQELSACISGDAAALVNRYTFWGERQKCEASSEFLHRKACTLRKAIQNYV